MREVIYTNIVWDVEDTDHDLPETHSRLIDDDVTDEDISEDSDDYLSDEFEYCVISFNYEIFDENEI